MSGKSKRTPIFLDADLVDRVGAVADGAGLSVTEWVSTVVTVVVEDNE